MALLSTDWVKAFSEQTGTPFVTNTNIVRKLQDAGLYSRPARGGAHRRTALTATDLTNFIFAQATDRATDAPEVVARLRRMEVSPEKGPPRLGDGTFGEAFDRMITG